MHSDQIDSPVAKAKTAKRIWLWGSVGFALVAWLVFWWVSNHWIATTLTDGRVVSYKGIQKGVKVSDNDFEPDVYAYPKKWFLTIPQSIGENILNKISRASLPPGAGSKDSNCYYSAPALMMLAGPNDGSVEVILDDGFGREKGYSFLNRMDCFVSVIPYASLPMRSPTWKIKFQDSKHHALGEFTVPNQSCSTAPQFIGKAPPLESQNSKGPLKLVSANYSVIKSDYDISYPCVILKFNAAAIPDLLPCHVIGVRITDSWGNTGFVSGSFSIDAGIIEVPCWTGAMQSEDWHIKVAICRGYGASFAPDETAIFKNISASSPMTQTIRGRKLTLFEATFVGNEAPKWTECILNWELDRNGPLLWPILVKAIGRTVDGNAVEVDPTKCEHQQPHKAGYQVTRQRYNYTYRGGITNDFLFGTYFKTPPHLKSLDLHVALEEPQVFEFFAKVSNWPTVPAEKK